MMRSLFSGVSGLQNHQTRMDVIGNNISNVNTYGFKKGRVTFQDMLSQTMTGAAKPTDTKGGVNPQQVGLGMMIASIDTIHTQGSLQVTGVNTDVAILGEGFFIQRKGEEMLYSRSGAFSIDADGKFVNPANGNVVQGWMSQVNDVGESIINTAAGVEDIIIPLKAKDPARATQNTSFYCNLQKSGNTHQSDITVYDETGIPRQLRATFNRNEDVINQWTVTMDVPDATEGSVYTNAGAGAVGTGNTFTLTFDDQGGIVSVADAAGGTLTDGGLTPSVTFTYPGTAGEVTQTLNIFMGSANGFDGITQFESPSTTKAIEQDGYTMGEMQSFSIDDRGEITGVFTNGNRKALAQLGLAKFTNAGGLEKRGDSTFAESNNSGAADIGGAGIQGRGSMKAGALEMSNVDLSEQFTDMIVTQRGFQSNARTITTSDQMIQEIIGLKR